MYVDLAERIVDRKINLENFLLFFHKNGFWGLLPSFAKDSIFAHNTLNAKAETITEKPSFNAYVMQKCLFSCQAVPLNS